MCDRKCDRMCDLGSGEDGMTAVSDRGYLGTSGVAAGWAQPPHSVRSK